MVLLLALAASAALAKAAAKDFWLALLGLNILTFPLLPLVVAKLRLCGRGMPSILHLKVLQCGVAVHATAEPASKENSVLAHFAVWLGGCFAVDFAAAGGTFVLAGFAAGGGGFLPFPEVPVSPMMTDNRTRQWTQTMQIFVWKERSRRRCERTETEEEDSGDKSVDCRVVSTLIS